MAVHRVTKILPYQPDQLAELVADVKSYPRFMRWVTGMRTWNRREERPGVCVEDAEAFAHALSDAGLEARDRFVIAEARSRGIPVASALGGGYGDDPRTVAARHARSMLAMADENAKYPPPAIPRAVEAAASAWAS